MRALNLNSLLGEENHEATFHDSELKRFDVNLEHSTATLYFDVPVASVEADTGGHEPVFRPGFLQFTGLLYFAVEPPRSSLEESPSESMWITSDGPLPDPRVKADLPLPDGVPDDAFRHYFFSSNTNSFVVVAALSAVFAWADGESAAGDRRRTMYYPGEEIPDAE